MKALPGIFSGIIAAVILTGTFLLPVEAFCAGNSGSEDFAQGNKALASGDYTAAVRFYRKAAMLLASPHREECFQKLCRAYLLSGDITAAAEILERFRKEYPNHPTGVLQGMIYAAEGNGREAVSEFKKVASGDSPARWEALYRLGAVYVAARSWQEALIVFEELISSDSAVNRHRGLNGKAYTLILSGQHKEAASLLEKMPGNILTERLKLLNMVQSGDLASFKKVWLGSREKNGDPRPEKLLYEVCGKAALLAEKNGDTDFAVLCLKDCFDFAPGDAERKDLMHRLFNLQSKSDIPGAVETVKRYSRIFPDAADRALLMLQCGRLLAGSGKNKEAVDIFQEVIRDEDNLLDERRSAAADAAQAAEKAGLYEIASQMHLYLISRSTTPTQKQSAEFDFGEYFVRRKDHAKAEERFRRVILQGGKMVDQARYRLLLVQIDSQQYSKAKETAEILAGSSVTEFSSPARFSLAELTEREGDTVKARKLYLDCLAKEPESRQAPAAAFAAARLAEKNGDLAAAAEEYTAFAGKYPRDVNAPAALFLALRACCTAGKPLQAEKILKILEEKYTAAPECGAAMLQLADHYFNRKENSAALALLNRSGQRYNDEIRAAFMLLESRVQLASGNSAAALETAKKLLEKYPHCKEAAETNLLCGNILSDLGENLLALQFFRKAERLNDTGLFGEAVSGRIADCLRVLYSGNAFDRKYIEEALKRYLVLGSNAGLPAVKLQSLCKAGSCYELAGDMNRASEYYEKTLYLAFFLKNNGFQPDPAWCGRAAYAGAQMALKGRRPERLVRALRMIRLYEELGLADSGEDFNTLRRELRNSYNLIKRKGI